MFTWASTPCCINQFASRAWYTLPAPCDAPPLGDRGRQMLIGAWYSDAVTYSGLQDRGCRPRPQAAV